MRLLADEVAFRSSFANFHDDLNGLTDEKLRKIGQEAIVVDIFDDQTMTCKFHNGEKLDFPWASVEALVSSCALLVQHAENVDHSSRCETPRRLSITPVDGKLISLGCSDIRGCRAAEELDFFICTKPAHVCQALSVLNKPMLIWFVLRPDRDWANQHQDTSRAGNFHVRVSMQGNPPCMRTWKEFSSVL